MDSSENAPTTSSNWSQEKLTKQPNRIPVSEITGTNASAPLSESVSWNTDSRAKIDVPYHNALCNIHDSQVTNQHLYFSSSIQSSLPSTFFPPGLEAASQLGNAP